jgi:hypothetical protein
MENFKRCAFVTSKQDSKNGPEFVFYALPRRGGQSDQHRKFGKSVQRRRMVYADIRQAIFNRVRHGRSCALSRRLLEEVGLFEFLTSRDAVTDETRRILANAAAGLPEFLDSQLDDASAVGGNDGPLLRENVNKSLDDG